MLCSVPAGKSGSKWLNRLRSAKGFPVENGLDLEQFLSRRKDEPSNSSDSKPSDASIGSKLNSNTGTGEARGGGGAEWRGLMSNVLSELFYMGDPVNLSRIGGKKSLRKQQNPKLCVLSAPVVVENANCYNRRDALPLASPLIPSSGGDNSCTEAKEMRGPSKMAKAKKASTCLAEDGEDDNNHQFNLTGFSCTDVTVIDTSIPSWKFDKLLFKKKNVWKVRDKKGKSASVTGKKREAKSLDHAGEKKLKKLCTSPKNAAEGDRGMPSRKVHHSGTSKVDKDCGETSPACQGSKKRFAGKSKEGGSSSVVLIKEIPPSNRKGQTSSIRVV